MQHLFFRSLKAISSLAIAALLLGGCGPKSIGYGVVLWAPNDAAYDNGVVVPVVAQSTLNRTYTLLIGDQQPVVENWRIAFFEQKEGARGYAERLEPYVDSFAVSLRTALPIRERPDRFSTRVYRLRDGEIMKVLGRTEEKSDEAGFRDYWYQVLTLEGVAGWVFGYYIEQSSAAGQPLTERSDRGAADRFLFDLTNQTWRPEYFAGMLRDQRINLSVFAPQFGFWGDFEAKTFTVSLPGLRQEFAYTDYFMPTPNRIEFAGISLTIELVSDNAITVQYTRNNQQRNDRFIRFSSDVQQLVDQELARRQSEVEQLISRGNVWVSTAYGTITVQNDGRLSWSGFERLVPQVLPATFPGQARMEMSAFIDRSLSGRYDGALRMVLPAGGSRVFLYTIADDGIRFVFVPDEAIRDDVVQREPLQPLVLFYRFVRS